jgi:hypothetical protein
MDIEEIVKEWDERHKHQEEMQIVPIKKGTKISSGKFRDRPNKQAVI